MRMIALLIVLSQSSHFTRPEEMTHFNAMQPCNPTTSTSDLRSPDDKLEYRWDSNTRLDPAVGVELLPVDTKVKVSYKGISVEMEQNVDTRRIKETEL